MLDRTVKAQGFRKTAVLVAMGLLFASLFAGCQLVNQASGSSGTGTGGSSTGGSTSGVQLTITQTTNGTTTTYSSGSTPFDYGPVDPNSTSGKSVSFTVENTSSASVTISGVTVDDTADYKFTTSSTTVAAGASVTLTGVFTPQSNKTYPATVTITGSSGNTTGSLTFPVTGEGNYPPVITFKITVAASSGFSQYSGTYTWDPSAGSIGAFKMGSSAYVYITSGLSPYWNLGSNTTSTPVMSTYGSTIDALPPMGVGNGGSDSWTTLSPLAQNSTTVDDSAAGVYDSTGSYDKAAVPGDALTVVPIANIQSDADNDAVGTPLYQWQYNSAIDCTGTWTDISGATSATLSGSTTTSMASSTPWFRVVVTPISKTGVKQGTPVASPPVDVGFGGG